MGGGLCQYNHGCTDTTPCPCSLISWLHGRRWRHPVALYLCPSSMIQTLRIKKIKNAMQELALGIQIPTETGLNLVILETFHTGNLNTLHLDWHLLHYSSCLVILVFLATFMLGNLICQLLTLTYPLFSKTFVASFAPEWVSYLPHSGGSYVEVFKLAPRIYCLGNFRFSKGQMLYFLSLSYFLSALSVIKEIFLVDG